MKMKSNCICIQLHKLQQIKLNRELSVLSDIDSGGDDGAEDALRLNLSERSSSMPTAF
jgi:hypothetical protein